MPVGDRRAQVRVDVELPADADQARLGPHRAAVPLRAADRAEQHRVGRAAGRERLRGQRVADRVDRRAAEELLLDLDVERQRLEHAHGLGHHLGPDPVAGQADDRGYGHRASSRRVRLEHELGRSSATPSSDSGPVVRALRARASIASSRPGSRSGIPVAPLCSCSRADELRAAG